MKIESENGIGARTYVRYRSLYKSPVTCYRGPFERLGGDRLLQASGGRRQACPCRPVHIIRLNFTACSVFRHVDSTEMEWIVGEYGRLCRICG